MYSLKIKSNLKIKHNFSFGKNPDLINGNKFYQIIKFIFVN